MILAKEDPSKRDLPPRTSNVQFIANVLLRQPVKVKRGVCGACDKHLQNEWVFDQYRPYCELRHLVDLGWLRCSEVDILLDALEEGELDMYWSHYKPDSLFLSFIFHLMGVPFILKQFFKKVKKALSRRYFSLCKNNWRISRNGNHYNPTIGATVYAWGDAWNVVRHRIHYEGFDSRQKAQEEAYFMWLEEKYPHKFFEETGSWMT